MKNQKVLMILSNTYSTDKRVISEAESLYRNGFSVQIVDWRRKKHQFSKKSYVLNGVKVYSIEINFTTPQLSDTKTPLLIFLKRIISQFLFYYKALSTGRKIDFDIIHCHDLDTLPIGVALMKMRRKKIVFDSHEGYIQTLGGRSPRFIVKIVDLLQKYLINKADGIIVVNDKQCEYFESKCGVKVHIVQNYPIIAHYCSNDQSQKDIKKCFGIDEELVISYAGYFTKNRKILELIDAVECTDNVKLLLAGGRSSVDYHKQIMQRVNNSSKVNYLGWFPVDDIPKLYLAADIAYICEADSGDIYFASSTKFYNGLLGGCAILCNEEKWNVSVITRNNNLGVVISEPTVGEIKKAIDLLNNDRELLNLYKNNSKNIGISNYTWDISEKSLIKLYSLLIKM